MSSDRIYGTETEYGLYLLQNQASPSGLFLRGLDYIKDIAYLGTKKVDLAKPLCTDPLLTTIASSMLYPL